MAESPERHGRTIGAVPGVTAIWIAFSAWCNAIAWPLSAIGRLNAAGYLGALAVTAVLAFLLLQKHPLPVNWPRFSWRRWRSRIRRQPVVAVYLFILITAALGGVIYPPTNHDGLTYRFPRVLHWIAEGRWHWIADAPESQMNLSTHGYEWIMSFLFALTRSDRLFFLVNLISYAVLPGLTFAVLTRLGVGRRAAAWWMWLLPCGYGLALQAGSIGNDLFAVPYLFGGIFFALRARETRSRRDVGLAVLAAALVTATKLSNAPLVLPIGIALMPSVKWVVRPRNLLFLAGSSAGGLLASALPVMIACTVMTGHFSGDPTNGKSLNIHNPVAGFVANSLQVAARNAMPPVNPAASAWNRSYRKWLPDSLELFLAAHYPRFDLDWRELPQEEGDGFGPGISLLLIIAAAGLVRSRPRTRLSFLSKSIHAGILIATGVYLIKMGSEAAPRLMIPYYAACLAVLLRSPLNDRLTRRRWWCWSATAAAALVLPAVILSPGRPLVPVQTLLERLPESIRSKPSVSRLESVYRTYAVRNDAMAPIRRRLPDDSEKIGILAQGRSLRIGLWRPFGGRKVEPVAADISASEIRERGLSALVIDPGFFSGSEAGLAEWAASRNLRVAGREEVLNYAGKPAEAYFVLIPE